MEVLLLSTDQGRSVIRDSATSRSYSPFGVLLSDVAEDSSVKFNGQRLERIARHYLLGNGYRAYSPSLMRFNSPDSESPFGKGGLNYYIYGKADPINYDDPSGHMPSRQAKLIDSDFTPFERLLMGSIGEDSFRNLQRTWSMEDISDALVRNKLASSKINEIVGANAVAGSHTPKSLQYMTAESLPPSALFKNPKFPSTSRVYEFAYGVTIKSMPEPPLLAIHRLAGAHINNELGAARKLLDAIYPDAIQYQKNNHSNYIKMIRDRDILQAMPRSSWKTLDNLS